MIAIGINLYNVTYALYTICFFIPLYKILDNTSYY